MNKKNFNVFTFFLKWRFAIFFLTSILFGLQNSIQSLANFDGQKFLKLAELGYGTPQTYYSYNLFPLYPSLIKVLSSYFGFLNSAIILSTFFAILSLYIFYRMSNENGFIISLVLFFPSAFFLNTAYSESLFLFLSIASLLSMQKGKILPAVILASLATYTRAAGMVLWLVIVIEYFESQKHWLKSLFNKRSVLLLIPPIGFLSYLKYLEVNTSNFLRFLPSIPDKFIFLHQVFLRYFKMIIFVDHQSHLFFVVLTELLLGLLALFLLVFRFNKTRLSYWVYLLAFFFVPSLWGNFSSIGRYLLTCPPFFFILNDYLNENPKLKKPYILLSTLLLILNLIFFSKGLFVG